MGDEIEEVFAEEVLDKPEMRDKIDVNLGELIGEIRNKAVHYYIETRTLKMWVRRIGLDSFASAFGFYKNSGDWFVQQHLSEDMMQINSFIEGRGVVLKDDSEFYAASKNYSEYMEKKHI